MAMVDFTNARIEPESPANQNAAGYSYLNMDASTPTDVNRGSVVSSGTTRVLENARKEFIRIYEGTFSTSGTEFYICSSTSYGRWKVSNISFSAGDTYVFQIKANLICQ